MRLSLTLLVTSLIATVNAKRAKRIISKDKADSVKANSRAGRKLLAKARRLDQEQEVDYSWLPDYTFQFQKCYSWEAYGREDNNENMEKSIVFRACPQGECSSSCKYGADYIVQLADYVEAYTTAKQNLREYNCQMVEENCECDDDQVDDEQCQQNCYDAAGLNYCNNDEEEFDPMNYAECAQLEMNNDNGRKLDEENALYGGIYCSDDNDQVLLGAFTDEACTTLDTSNAYYQVMGQSLPYSSKSIVGSGCVSCTNPFYVEGDDDNDDNQDNINEMCMEVYDLAGKCETDLSINYPTTDACVYINNVVPNLDKLYKGEKVKPAGTSALTWLFGFTTLALAGYIGYTSYNKKTASIDLAEQGGVMT